MVRSHYCRLTAVNLMSVESLYDGSIQVKHADISGTSFFKSHERVSYHAVKQPHSSSATRRHHGQITGSSSIKMSPSGLMVQSDLHIQRTCLSPSVGHAPLSALSTIVSEESSLREMTFLRTTDSPIDMWVNRCIFSS